MKSVSADTCALGLGRKNVLEADQRGRMDRRVRPETKVAGPRPRVKLAPIGVNHFMKGIVFSNGMNSPKMTSSCLWYRPSTRPLGPHQDRSVVVFRFAVDPLAVRGPEDPGTPAARVAVVTVSNCSAVRSGIEPSGQITASGCPDNASRVRGHHLLEAGGIGGVVPDQSLGMLGWTGRGRWRRPAAGSS